MTHPEGGAASQTSDPPVPKTIHRSYRIERAVWEGAAAKAAALGIGLSTVVERFLRAWLQGIVPLPKESVELTIDDDDTDERDGPS